MRQLMLRYCNRDGRFRFDEAIRAAMSRWPAKETDSGQVLETHWRYITCDFEDDSDDCAVLEDLNKTLEDRFGKGEAVCTRQALASMGTHQVVILGRPNAAQEVFDSYSDRLNWDFLTKADVLTAWFSDHMVEVLLERIQDTGECLGPPGIGAWG